MSDCNQKLSVFCTLATTTTTSTSRVSQGSEESRASGMEIPQQTAAPLGQRKRKALEQLSILHPLT